MQRSQSAFTDAAGESILLPQISGLAPPRQSIGEGAGGEVSNSPAASFTALSLRTFKVRKEKYREII